MVATDCDTLLVPEEASPDTTEAVVEEFERKNVPKQEQSVYRIRYFTKNKDTGVQEEIRPLTGSKWNLAPTNTANPYRTFDNQPIYKVISNLNHFQ